MTQIVSVRFNEFGKAYYFSPGELTVKNGDNVIVETAKGLEYGHCVRGNHEVNDDEVVEPLRPVIRLATDEDNNSLASGKEKEKEAFSYCQQKILDFGLEMKLVRVEYGFEGSKILFFLPPTGVWTSESLLKTLPECLRPASSCVKSVCVTKQSCSVVLVFAESSFAAASF